MAYKQKIIRKWKFTNPLGETFLFAKVKSKGEKGTHIKTLKYLGMAKHPK